MTPKQFVAEVRRLDKLAETVSDANEQLGHLLIANAAALADVVAESEILYREGFPYYDPTVLKNALARLGAGQEEGK